jgi:hypothetical protein
MTPSAADQKLAARSEYFGIIMNDRRCSIPKMDTRIAGSG